MNLCVQLDSSALAVILNLLIFAIGTAVLVKGSDLFIDAAAAIARIWKVPELVIGLTLVSIGTSLPELASSVYASILGAGEFTIGNIVGSNVTNIALILGIGILGAGKLAFRREVPRRDGGVMMAVYAVTCLLFALTVFPLPDGTRVHGLDVRSGILLLVLCLGYLYLLFRHSRKHPEEVSGGTPAHTPVLPQLGLLLLGVVMITAGSKAMVDPVIWGAERLGISMLVISSTLVAFGTSVPELAVTLAGVIKKQHDIALGNIIGSNIFNILLIFGVTAVIHPLPLLADGPGLFNLGAMVAVALALLGCMFSGKDKLTRGHGFFLLALYVVFLWVNCRAAFAAR